MDALSGFSIQSLINMHHAEQVKRNEAAQAMEDIKQEIASKVAEFKVGDKIEDRKGQQWIVTRFELKWMASYADEMRPEAVRYYGKRLKKNGELHKLEAEAYNTPLKRV